MREGALLEYLEGLAEQVGIRVRYAVLADEELTIQSGHCVLRGAPLLIIDRALPEADRVRVLAEHLATCDLEAVYVLPRAREVIEAHGRPRRRRAA